MIMINFVSEVQFVNNTLELRVVWYKGSTVEVWDRDDLLEAHTIEEPTLEGASRWASLFFEKAQTDPEGPVTED